jgi:amidase
MQRQVFLQATLVCCILVLERAVAKIDPCCCFASNQSSSKSIIDDILNLDALSLSRAIESKQITCEELMKATLDRIDEVNPRCNAIILVRDRNELMEEARCADQNPRRGWLHGIPTAIKDISNAKGIATTMGGSRLSKNFVPNFNDFHVGNLVQAGAIVIGKTNSPENGLGSHTFNERWGATLNPFDFTKSAGGSSGGAGVAVASRILCAADGTDMMGSLRNPAGWNNIYSHRPTAGMIRGSMASKKNPLPYPTSTAGPMARTPMDCAMLLETMAGKDRFDSMSVLGDELGLETFRIGWLGDWGQQLPFEEGVVELCRTALGRLEERGAVIDDITEEIFPLDQLWTSWNRIRFGTAAALFSQSFNMDILLGNQSPIKEELQWEIEQGLQISDEELSQAKRIRDEFSERLDTFFDKYDVLALPSAQLFPFPQDWKWPKEVGGMTMDTYHRWMQVCVPVSLGGLPCSTIPAGFGKNGLPMGIQLFSRREYDAKTLLLAQAYHGIVDWPSLVKPSEDENALLSHCAKTTK